jgi:hypothetical protein
MDEASETDESAKERFIDRAIEDIIEISSERFAPVRSYVKSVVDRMAFAIVSILVCLVLIFAVLLVDLLVALRRA